MIPLKFHSLDGVWDTRCRRSHCMVVVQLNSTPVITCDHPFIFYRPTYNHSAVQGFFVKKIGGGTK